MRWDVQWSFPQSIAVSSISCIIALVLKEPLPAACHRDDEDDAVQQTQDTRARLCQLNVGITLIDRDIVGYSNCTLARTTKD